MDIQMVFNELSVQQPADTIYAARQRMVTYIETTETLTKQGIKPILRLERSFFDILLAENYPVRAWLKDRAVDQDDKRGMLRFANYPIPKKRTHPIEENIETRRQNFFQLIERCAGTVAAWTREELYDR